MRGSRRPWQCFPGALVLIAAAGAALAEEPRPQRPEWGTKDRILAHVPFTDFVSQSGTQDYLISDGFAGAFGISSPLVLARFYASPRVPSGALLTYLELDFCDVDLGNEVELSLYDCAFVGDDCHVLKDLSSAAAQPGCGFDASDLTSQNFTVNNNSRQLLLIGSVAGGSEATQLTGAYVGYRLQISPAPSTATFGDVPTTHLYFRAIEALAASGITAGCGSGNFCPNQNVTRGEMAAFFARALGLHFAN